MKGFLLVTAVLALCALHVNADGKKDRVSRGMGDKDDNDKVDGEGDNDNDKDDDEDEGKSDNDNDQSNDDADVACADATWTIESNDDYTSEKYNSCEELGAIFISWDGETSIDLTLPTKAVGGSITIEVQEKSNTPLKAVSFPNLAIVGKDIVITAKKAFTTDNGDDAVATIAGVSMPALTKAGGTIKIADKVHHGLLGPISIATASTLEKLNLDIKPQNSGPGVVGDVIIGTVAAIGDIDINTGITVGKVLVNGGAADSCDAGKGISGDGLEATSIKVEAGKGKGAIAAVRVFGLRKVGTVRVKVGAGNTVSDVSLVGDNTGLTIGKVEVAAKSKAVLPLVAFKRVVEVTKEVYIDVATKVGTYNGVILGARTFAAKELKLNGNDSDGGDGPCGDGELHRVSDDDKNDECYSQGGDACSMVAAATTTVASSSNDAATDAPATDAPATDAAATTTVASSSNDATDAPATDAPATDAPATTTVASSSNDVDAAPEEAAAPDAGVDEAAPTAEDNTPAGKDAAVDGVPPAVGELSLEQGDASPPTDGETVPSSDGAADPAPGAAGDEVAALEEEPPTAEEVEAAAAADAECNAALLEATGQVCMNGGVCKFKRANCNDATLPFDTPVCACADINQGTCFYGQHCQVKVSGCNLDAQSCNIVKNVRDGTDPAAVVCSTSPWPARLCTAEQPPALAGASVMLQEEDAVAPAEKNSAGGIIAGLLVVIFLLVLIGMYHRSRKQQAEEAGAYGLGIWDTLTGSSPAGTKSTMMTSVENPMYMETDEAVGGAEIGSGGAFNAEPMYDLGSEENFGEGYLAVGADTVDDPVYDLGSNAGAAEPTYDLGSNASDLYETPVAVGANAQYEVIELGNEGSVNTLLAKHQHSPAGHGADCGCDKCSKARAARLGMENEMEVDKLGTFKLEKQLRAVDDETFDKRAAKRASMKAAKRASMKASKKGKSGSTKAAKTSSAKKGSSKKKAAEKKSSAKKGSTKLVKKLSKKEKKAKEAKDAILDGGNITINGQFC